MEIDLNADVGEGDDDEPLYGIVTSVNVACGVHAGDPATMATAVERALAHGCAIGAHPGYADREHRGRRPLSLYPAEVAALVATQVHDLAAIVRARGGRMRHVKPHGALYNQAARDAKLARAIVAGVAAVDASLAVVGLAGGELIAAAEAFGLSGVPEAFCDRAYRPDGSLVPRSEPGALVDDPARAAAQAVALARGEPVHAAGATVRVAARTLCLHADTPGAAASARAVRAALEDAGVTLRAL